MSRFSRWLVNGCTGAGVWLALWAAPVPAWAAPPTGLVRVEVDSQTAGAALPADFTGLSFEMKYVLPDTNGGHFFRADNLPLAAMFRTLGIKSLRVGGNTADRPGLPSPGPADVDSLFAFARAAGVRVIYTLRLREGSLTNALAMADYLHAHDAPLVAGLAIGNEPNVFNRSFAPYLAAWRLYAAAITAPGHWPGAPLCGPGTSPGHEAWARQMAELCGRPGPLRMLTQHDYPGGDARRATNAAVARAALLAPAMDAHYARFASGWVPAAQAAGLPWRLEEANSLYDGGAPGVSDTAAAALWALDYEWWWAARGADGINFHTGDKVAARDESKPCRYAVFWTAPDGCHAHPLAYGLKAFTLAARGRLLATRLENPADCNARVYAASAAPGNLIVTLINRETGPDARTVEFALTASAATRDARVLRLTTPRDDAAAREGMTLGGAAIQDDGAWPGHWIALPRPDKPGPLMVSVPPAGAALVSLTLR